MKKILAATVTLISSLAMADDIRLGLPSYGGNGCPGGSVSAVLSDDSQTLSILFDQMQAEAGRHVNKTFDRKSCNVAIPVHIPQGFSVSLLQLDYRGYNNLPAGAKSQFNVEYFFAGRRGPRFQRNFGGPLSQDYLVENDLTIGAIVWSRCGVDEILRTNTSMTATSNGRGDQTLATIDSVDIQAGVIYKLSWKRCN